MSGRLLLSLCGGLLLLLCLPALASAAPAGVTLRVEGSSATLVPRAAIRTDTRAINKDGQPGHTCTGTSAAGALEQAAGGDWGGSWFDGLGYSVERVRSEVHAFPAPEFFSLWVNNRASSLGICQTELQQGDEVLFFVARCQVGPPPDFACQNPPVLPLGLSAPRVVRPGTPFSVRVVEYAENGTPSPAAGAAVAGGDGVVITDARGNATIALGAGGERALRATKANRAASASEPVCATTGSDGLCGNIVPSGCATSGSDGRCGTRDRTAPRASLRGIREQQRFARGKGPRRLRAHVDPDPSGLREVKLRLTRNDKGRCSYFSGGAERFRRNRLIRGKRCGAERGYWFAVGDRQDVDYLLPRRLSRGRYVLDVTAIDKAGNRDDGRQRGRNRIVFYVR